MSIKSFLKIIVLLIAVYVPNLSMSQTGNDFKLISSAFADGKPIPAKYTCDGTNISPPLSWNGYPDSTKSFAIIMDDPDANGTWVHWVMYNIPALVNILNEKIDAEKINAMEGLNSWEEKGYSGPCPPGGSHRYNFKLYALDTVITAKDPLNKEQLLEKIKGHVLSETMLTGIFRNY